MSLSFCWLIICMHLINFSFGISILYSSISDLRISQSYEIIKLQDLLAKNSFTNIGSVIRYRDFTSFLKSINNKFRATSPSFLCCLCCSAWILLSKSMTVETCVLHQGKWVDFLDKVKKPNKRQIS